MLFPSMESPARKLLFSSDGRLRSGWKILSFLGAVLVVLWGTSSLIGLTLGRDFTFAWWMPSQWIMGFICLLVTLPALYFERRPLTSVGFRADRRWAIEFSMGFLIGFILLGLAALVVLGLGGFHWERDARVGLSMLLKGAWVYLAVAFFEETLFRGYPFQRLIEGIGAWPGLLLGGILFALAHLGNPGMSGSTQAWAFINITLAGLLLGLGWFKTKNLALPIGLHLGWNWTQGTLLGFGVSGGNDPGLLKVVFHNKPQWLTGGEFGLEASLPCAVLCAMVIAAMIAWKGPITRAEESL
jgi:membrane protease YdiL (CAAX protease family)